MSEETINIKTLKEILENPVIKDIAPNAISKWDLSKEEFYNWSLNEISTKMGWECIKSGLETLLKNAEGGNYYFNLYSLITCKAIINGLRYVSNSQYFFHSTNTRFFSSM